MKKLLIQFRMAIFLILLLCFAISCQLLAEKAETEKEAKVLAVRKVIEEAWNKVNLEVLDEVYATDFIQHRTPFPDIEGLEAYKQYIASTRKAYPNLQFTIEEIIVDGDTTALWFTFQGTHEGETMMFPILPTDEQVTMKGCTIGHWVEGKAVEEWVYADWLGLMQQLGLPLAHQLIPTPLIQDAIILKNGGFINGKVLTEVFNIRTSYGQVAVKRKDVRDIHVKSPEFENNDVILEMKMTRHIGVLQEEIIDVKLQNGQVFKIEKNQIHTIMMLTNPGL
jgi:predicted ester cyclase